MSHKRLRHTLPLLLPFSSSLRKLDILSLIFWQVVVSFNIEKLVKTLIAYEAQNIEYRPCEFICTFRGSALTRQCKISIRPVP